MENKFYISKGPNYRVAWALLKEASAIKLKIKSLLPEAKKNYQEAKQRYESYDYPVAECYKPYHVFDEINSLASLSKELRDKAYLLKAWLDKFNWFEVTENGYTFRKAECSKAQKDFCFNLRNKYKALINKYYPKGGGA